MHLRALLRDYRARFRTRNRADNCHARFDDAGFFCRNFRNGMAEKVFVVEVDGRDDGYLGRDNVRRVQPAA